MKVKRVHSMVTAAALLASCGLVARSLPVQAANVTVAGGVPGVVMLGPDKSAAAGYGTATPIKHLVVIFQENVSFDHYFGTYPNAANLTGETPFTALANSPSINGLSGPLLTNNPNLYNPARLTPKQALTCDQDHNYTDEQRAYDNGLVDKFVQSVSGKSSNSAQYCPPGVVMDYFDGNTVTALWNYAQHYAMNDNSFDTNYGPSTPGALNLIAATTGNVVCGPSGTGLVGTVPTCSTSAPASGPSAARATIISDPDPYYDKCSNTGATDKSKTAAIDGNNIGDLLNAKSLTWGWFQGGFADCTVRHPDVAYDQLVGTNPSTDPNTYTDYSPHHSPFQYFPSTSNPQHLPPSNTAMIGSTDQANHNYDLTNFWQAADSGNLPAVSFLKAPEYQDGHAGYSNPIDEQVFVTNTINHLMSLPSWSSTAIIIGYDDSDGWYDHVMPPLVNHSNSTADVNCGTTSDGQPGRCGYGPRLPYIVISPWAKTNYVDHTLIDQTSTTRFIEDNWLGGQRLGTDTFDNKAGSILGMFDFSRSHGNNRLFLNPVNGQVVGNNGFLVTFTSTNPGRGMVLFNAGTTCSGLVQTATNDLGAGTTNHTILVTGNDLPGTVGNIGLTPGQTYSFEVVTNTGLGTGTETDNNSGQCYQVTIPAR